MVQLSYIFAFTVAYLASLALSVAIAGIQGGVDQTTGQRPSRPSLTDFSDSGPAFDLYIQSLQQFQAQGQSAQLSYYQVAGIHGYPYNEWDGAQGTYRAGYCTHGSILFPMWHRPYLALFEACGARQILWNNAQNIVRSYPVSQQNRYEAAAMTFRIPYWDWAYNATMPDVVNQPYVSINTPQGFMNVVNPLYNYTFHPQPSASDFPPATSLAKYHSTVRYPDANGHSQPAKSNAQLQANAQPLHDLTYQLIAEQSNYAPFSNAAYSDGRGNSYNSIENMHNAIHSLVGQTGHMAIISYSSFDPIFWLHHANVDRLIAIWQAIHPESFTISQVNQDGTYTNAPAMTEDEHTPLTPFHSDNNGTFYTSVTARYTRHFGYTYPEIIDWDVNSTQLFSNVRRNLNLLYNPSGSLSSRSLAVARMPDHMPREEEPNLLNKDGAGIWVAPASPSRALTLGKEDNASRPLNTTKGKAESANYQYFVNIRVDKTALNQSFFIHFFLGTVPSNPTLWSTSPTLIASQSILYYPSFSLSPTSSNITNNNKNKNNNNTNHYHQRPTNRTTYGQIPLTHALHSPFHPTSIIPHLRTHLQWRIQTFDNTPVDINASSTTLSALKASLKIFVVGRKVVSEARDDLFPVYGALRVHREATRGKAGGIGLEDEREESEDKDEEQEEGI